MPVPSTYLDENVDVELADYLERRGCSVTTAQAARTAGLDDEGQLAHAAARGLVLISHNQRHFRRWHAIFQQHGRSHAGIILIPQSPLRRLEVRAAMMLDWIATFPDHRSRLFRWHDLQYQLTRGYRLPGYSEEEVRIALGQSA